MSDRELLEMAAKAAGLSDMKYLGGAGVGRMIDPTRPDETGTIGLAWNPLTDDGDALRLAVKLRLLVDVRGDRTDCVSLLYWDGESHDDDPLAATRRAIVRAAAKIGKAMP